MIVKMKENMIMMIYPIMIECDDAYDCDDDEDNHW